MFCLTKLSVDDCLYFVPNLINPDTIIKLKGFGGGGRLEPYSTFTVSQVKFKWAIYILTETD